MKLSTETETDFCRAVSGLISAASKLFLTWESTGFDTCGLSLPVQQRCCGRLLAVGDSRCMPSWPSASSESWFFLKSDFLFLLWLSLFQSIFLSRISCFLTSAEDFINQLNLYNDTQRKWVTGTNLNTLSVWTFKTIKLFFILNIKLTF